MYVVLHADAFWPTAAPIVSAVIAAIAVLAVTWFSVNSQRTARRSEEESQRRQRQVDFRWKQLDGLYGEMYLLRSTSRRLWERLRGSADEFRLIDNIVDIKNEDSDRRRLIVEEILAINDRIADLIETGASLLVDFPPPESFLQFLEHHRTLRRLWSMGENAHGDEASFPRGLDADIGSGIETIKGQLKALDQPT